MTDADDDVKAKFREALDKKEESEGDHPVAEGVENDGSEKSHAAAEPLDTGEFHPKSEVQGDR